MDFETLIASALIVLLIGIATRVLDSRPPQIIVHSCMGCTSVTTTSSGKCDSPLVTSEIIYDDIIVDDDDDVSEEETSDEVPVQESTTAATAF